MPTIPKDATVETLLWIIAGVLASCIVALVIYIKHIHSKNEKHLIKHNEKMIEIATAFVAAVNNNSATIDKLDGSVKMNALLVNDLHKYILNLERKH